MLRSLIDGVASNPQIERTLHELAASHLRHILQPAPRTHPDRRARTFASSSALMCGC